MYGLDHIQEIPGYDPAYELAFYSSWCSYEESGWVAIVEKDGQLYELGGGYSVMGDGEQPDEWDLFPIGYDRAIEIINDWEEIERNDSWG